MPEGREQVRLADAEPAIEVHTRLGLDPLAAAAEEACGTGRLPGFRERLQPVDGLRLRRIVMVGAVRLERGVHELGRRYEFGRDLGAGDRRRALGEAHDGTGLFESHGEGTFVSKSYRTHSRRVA